MKAVLQLSILFYVEELTRYEVVNKHQFFDQKDFLPFYSHMIIHTSLGFASCEV